MGLIAGIINAARCDATRAYGYSWPINERRTLGPFLFAPFQRTAAAGLIEIVAPG